MWASRNGLPRSSILEYRMQGKLYIDPRGGDRSGPIANMELAHRIYGPDLTGEGRATSLCSGLV